MHKRALKEDRQWRLSGLSVLREDVVPLGFGEGLFRMILLYLAIVAGVTVVFVVLNHVPYWLVLATLPSALILGLLLHLMLAHADRFWDRSVSRSGHLQTAFLLFFIYLPVFAGIFYLVLAYPIGVVLSSHIASPELATDYRRWILDVAAVSAMVAWGCLVFRKR